MAEALPTLVYDHQSVDTYAAFNDNDGGFNTEPPVATVIDPLQVKERVMDYLGAVLARCWFDRELMADMERDAHRALRHIGILLPDELEIRVERTNKERPRLIIYEHNQERTFKRRVCYLQMIMLAGR